MTKERKPPIFPQTKPIPKYSFTVAETQELCYNQASLRLRELANHKEFSSYWFKTVKDLSFFLNMLTDEQFTKLNLEFNPKSVKKVEIATDDIFG